MSKIAVIDARKDLADILNRAAYGKERVILTRRGKDVAAIVPLDDLKTLEAIEDHMDVVESEKILERVRAGSEQLLSLDEVKAKYQSPSRAVELVAAGPSLDEVKAKYQSPSAKTGKTSAPKARKGKR